MFTLSQKRSARMITALHEDNLVATVIICSVVFLLLFSFAALFFFSTKTSLSVLTGGAVGITNFIWMRGTLRRILGLASSHPVRSAAFWFVARMIVMGAVLCLLMISRLFSILGLVAGLSVTVVAIIFITFLLAIQRTEESQP